MDNQLAQKTLVDRHGEGNHPSAAKAVDDFVAFSGTDKSVPFQNCGSMEFFRQAVKAGPFKTAAQLEFFGKL